MISRLLVLFLLLTAGLRATTTYWFDSAPFTTYGEFNPLPLFTQADSGHTAKQLNPSQKIRFASNSATIAMRSYTSTAAGRTYRCWQDGVPIGDVVFPATGGGSYSTYTFATGIPIGSVHEYVIACVTPIQGSSGNWLDSGLVLDDNSLATVLHPAQLNLAMYGDSVTGVTNAHMTTISSPAITDTTYADMWIASWASGRAITIVGSGGGKINGNLRDNTASIPAGVDQVHLRGGINDLPDLGTAPGRAAFQTAYTDTVNNIRAQIGAGKPIWCYQPQPVSGQDVARAFAATLIQAALVGLSNVVYVSTDNWYPTNADYLPDGTHPNAMCYNLYATQEIRLWGGQGAGSNPGSGGGVVIEFPRHSRREEHEDLIAA